MSVIDRIPPAALEAEAAVLGGVLVAPDLLDAVSGIIGSGDFHTPLHGLVFDAVVALRRAKKPIDKVSLAEELRARGMLDRVGGIAYLSGLYDAVPTAASVEAYAKIVREKAVLRALVAAGVEIQRLGYDGEADAERAVTEAAKALAVVTTRGVAPAAVEQPGTLLRSLADDLVAGRRPVVYDPPWGSLSRQIGGFAPGELIAVPAAPGTGKSALLLTDAEYAAETQGAVAYFALEMGREETERRRLAMRSGVPMRAMRMGDFGGSDRSRIATAAAALEHRPLYTFGRPHGSLAAMWGACREIVQRHGKVVRVYVDTPEFLSDVQRPERGTTLHERLSAAYIALLDLAQTFAVPVLCAVHFTREAMKGRPTIAALGGLRNGGNMEGHAHVVAALWSPDQTGASSDVEMIVLKARNGARGPVELAFDAARGLYREVQGRVRDAHGHIVDAHPGVVMPAWFERRAEVPRSTAVRHDNEDDIERFADDWKIV